MDNFTNLTGVGVAGLAVYLFWKLSANHVAHNTKAIFDLRDAIKELKDFLERRI